MSDQRQLGKIDDVNLTIEDHGILTLQVGFDFGGTHQGFGGYCLDTYNEEENIGKDTQLGLISYLGF